MAISTKLNSLLADQMFSIYSNAETLMLEKLAKRVAKGITEEGWTERKAKEITKIRTELEKLTNDVKKISSFKITEAIKKAYESGVKSANKDFKLPTTIISDYEIPASVQRLVLESNMIISNTSDIILRSTTDEFRRIQAEVSTGVLVGVETRGQIARRMLNRLADNGITSFVDKAGRNWEMGTYAEMATRTVTARAAVQGHLDRQAQYGRDLVVISDHAGECPICRPWENKVLSISGTDPKYPSLASAREAGLFHPNCRHTLTGYIPGLTKLEPTATSGVPEQYNYTQMQRANERQIRRWKRREAVAISPKDLALARSKIQLYQKAQRDLLKEYEEKFGMTLRRKYDRESIRNRVGKSGIEKVPEWTKIEGKELPPKTPKVPKIPKEPKKVIINKAGMSEEEVKAYVLKLEEESKAYRSAMLLKYAVNTTEELYKKATTWEVSELKRLRGNSIRFLSGDDIKPKGALYKTEQALKKIEKEDKKKLKEYLKKQEAEKKKLIKEKIRIEKLKAKINGSKTSVSVNPDDYEYTGPYREAHERDKVGFFKKEGNEEMRSAVSRYTGSFYGTVNDVLRGKRSLEGFSDDVLRDIKLLKEFKGSGIPAEKNIKLYRHNKLTSLKHLFGVNGQKIESEVLSKAKDIINTYRTEELAEKIAEFKNIVKDAEIWDKSVLSTSTKNDIFLKNDGMELEILVPKGFNKGAFSGKISSHPNEAEYLFSKEQKFIIKDVKVVKRAGGYKNISLVVMPIE